MTKRAIAIIIAILTIAILIGVAQYVRGLAGDTRTDAGASNTDGPAEGGALETGGALNPDAGYRRLPARDMPNTISEYPPTGAETNNPPPPR
jgi:hypothetical protein